MKRQLSILTALFLLFAASTSLKAELPRDSVANVLPDDAFYILEAENIYSIVDKMPQTALLKLYNDPELQPLKQATGDKETSLILNNAGKTVEVISRLMQPYKDKVTGRVGMGLVPMVSENGFRTSELVFSFSAKEGLGPEVFEQLKGSMRQLYVFIQNTWHDEEKNEQDLVFELVDMHGVSMTFARDREDEEGVYYFLKGDMVVITADNDCAELLALTNADRQKKTK
ncbi:MAG: hypothetical protein U5N86_14075 [Planctomycetota bacterium]|nr:hypothetical protein [Planctomycetota bacterium]